MQAGLCADVHTSLIICLGFPFHEAFDLPELAAHFHHDALGCPAHRGHGQGCKDKGQAGADEDAHKDGGVHDAHVQNHVTAAHFLDFLHVGGDQGQSGEGCAANGKSFACGSCGVAKGVQSIRALAHRLLQTRHLRDTAGVVSDGAVGVSGQGDAQSGEHAHSRQGDAVEPPGGLDETAGESVGCHDAHGDDDDGNGCGQHAQAQAPDDDGGGAGLGFVCQVLGRFICIRCEVFRKKADQHSGQQTAQDGKVKSDKVLSQNEPYKGEGDNGYDESACVGSPAESLQKSALVCVFTCLYKHGADDGCQHADGGQDHGDHHRVDSVHGLDLIEGNDAQGAGGEDGAHVGLVEIGAHTGHVAYIVPHIVCNDSRISGIVLGDAGLHFSYKVSSHIGSFRVDAAAHTGEESHRRSAHTEGQHGACDIFQRELKD